jgi:hypothetical protein
MLSDDCDERAALPGRLPTSVTRRVAWPVERDDLDTIDLVDLSDGKEGRMTPLGPAEEEERLRSIARDITLVAPVEPRGWRELLRLATGLALGMPGMTGQRVAEAAEALRIQPARVDRVVVAVTDSGALAIVEGRLLALGGRLFLRELGIKPQVAEARVADRIERSGDVALFVVAVARGRILGVLGVHR